MRGREPHPLSIAAADLPILQQVARGEFLPWYQVRRARIVLANARGERTSTIANRLECDAATVWRTCRRYERQGLTGLLAAPCRSGHPDRISPPPAGSDRRPGLLGTDRQGLAYHPLGQ
jgi:Homeodomain-like domain